MRLTTINVDKFQHDGIVADRGWTEFHYTTADAKAQASFREHVGRFVRIHPEDVGELAEHGLALKGGRIVEAPKPVAPPPVAPPPAAAPPADLAPAPPAADGKAAADDGKGKGKTR